MDIRQTIESNNDLVLSAKLAERTDVVIIKLQGMFYNAYSDSAKVLHGVTGYKVKQNSSTSQPKCGFPSQSVYKVVDALQGAGVSFVIMNKDAVVFYSLASKNRFNEILNGFSDSDLVRVWMKDVEMVIQDKDSNMINEGVEIINNKKKHSLFDFLRQKRRIFFVSFALFMFATAVIVSMFMFAGNISNSIAKTSQKNEFETYDPSDVVLCDYTDIPISVNLPSSVKDEDLSIYMDKVLSEFSDDVTSVSVTDEFCSDKLGVSSVDEFRSALKADLYSYRNEYINDYIDGAVKFYLLEKSQINIPAELYDDLFENRVQQQIDLFVSQYCDGNIDNYESKTKELTVYKSTDELEDFLRETVKDSFDLHLIYMAIAGREGIVASGKEFDTWVKGSATNQGFSDVEEFYHFYDTQYETGEDYIKEQFIYEKVLTMVSENVSVIYNDNSNITDVMFSVK